MNKQNLLVSTVASALALPGIAFAAIDDQGMAYVSASEGLSGTIRMNLWQDKKTNNNGTTNLNSLRLYLSGNSDLGGGLKSTYYAELRNGGEDNQGIGLHAYDIGIEGPFGALEAGRLDGVTGRMVPGGSLDNVAGSSAASPYGDPQNNGIRYETPVLQGAQFGISFITGDTNPTAVPGEAGTSNGETPGAFQDQVVADTRGSIASSNVAVNYSLAQYGLSLGFGLESVARAGRVAVDSERSAWADGQKGYRAGIRYTQDNWIIGYEVRNYDGFDGGFGQVIGTGTAVSSFEDDNSEYAVHRFAGQFSFDRVTASANYSTESIKTKLGAVAFDLDKTTLGIDAYYALGSKTFFGVGYQTQTTEEYNASQDTGTGITPVVAATAKKDNDETTTTLYYRVDF